MQKVNERIAEVRELISSQEKLIQSAHGLLKVTTDADKRALLAASIESREKNLEKLHKELQSLHGECVCGGVGQKWWGRMIRGWMKHWHHHSPFIDFGLKKFFVIRDCGIFATKSNIIE